MSNCNRLDLQTRGSQPVVMPKNLPDHCLIKLVYLWRYQIRGTLYLHQTLMSKYVLCLQGTLHFEAWAVCSLGYPRLYNGKVKAGPT